MKVHFRLSRGTLSGRLFLVQDNNTAHFLAFAKPHTEKCDVWTFRSDTGELEIAGDSIGIACNNYLRAIGREEVPVELKSA